MKRRITPLALIAVALLPACPKQERVRPKKPRPTIQALYEKALRAARDGGYVLLRAPSLTPIAPARLADGGTAAKPTYAGLRTRALTASRAQLGVPKPAKPGQPWGVVTDWNIGDFTGTTVAFSGGSASVYNSIGNGVIGGGRSREAIRKAAIKAVAAAIAYRGKSHRVTTFPLPAKRGKVICYLRTDDGVLMAKTGIEKLVLHDDPLSPVYYAMGEVIMGYRHMLLETWGPGARGAPPARGRPTGRASSPSRPPR